MRSLPKRTALAVLLLAFCALPLMGDGCNTTTTEKVLDARLVGSWQDTLPTAGEPGIVFTVTAEGDLTRLVSRHEAMHDDPGDTLTIDGRLYSGPTALQGLWSDALGEFLALFLADTYELQAILPQNTSTIELGNYSVNGTAVSLIGTELGKLTAYKDDGTFVSRARGVDVWGYNLTGGTGGGGNVLALHGQLLSRVSGVDGGNIVGGWETSNTTGERHGFEFSNAGVLTWVRDYVDVSFIRTYRQVRSYEYFVEDNTLVSVGERLVGTYSLNNDEDTLEVYSVYPSTGRYASITTGGTVLILGSPAGTISYDRTLGTGNVMNGTWEASGGTDVWTFNSTTASYTHTVNGEVVETGAYSVISGQNWVEFSPLRVYYRQ